MNLQETIRKVLKESEVSSLIRKILRRVDLETAVEQSLNWCVQHYGSKAQEAGLQWFVETVVYNVYIDYVSPIFEEWDENGDNVSITISKDDEKRIMKFLERHFYDRIKEEYIKSFGEEEPYIRPR